jgi:hypothetical protein
MNKHQVVSAEGKVLKRNSKNAVYSHVLLGRKDYRRRRASIIKADGHGWHEHHWAAAHGEKPDWLRYVPERFHAEQEAELKADVAQYASMEEYKAAKVAEEIAKYAPEGKDWGAEEALRWSRSEKLAANAMSEFEGRQYGQFRVVAVELVK